MATMNVSLPDALKAWAESEARSGSYGNTSDYVRDLIRRDQQRKKAIRELRQLIDEGVASGVSTRTVDEIFEDAMSQAQSGSPPDA